MVLKKEKQSNESDKKEKGLYVYCIIPSSEVKEEKQKGIDGVGNLFSVQWQELAAVVSEIEIEAFKLSAEEKKIHKEWLEKKARNHLEIVETLMKEHNILPVSFGAVITDKAAIVTFLKDHYDEYIKALERLKGREAWEVKVYLDFEILKQYVTDHSEEIAERKKMLSLMVYSDAFLMKKKVDRMIEESLEKHRDAIVLHIENTFREVSEREFFSKVEDYRQQQTEPPLVFKASYLIRKALFTEFTHKIKELSDQFEQKGIIFEVVGPWPPYLFIENK